MEAVEETVLLRVEQSGLPIVGGDEMPIPSSTAGANL
jgi:hypothetical protein